MIHRSEPVAGGCRVPLRDVQEAASRADPRTMMREGQVLAGPASRPPMPLAAARPLSGDARCSAYALAAEQWLGSQMRNRPPEAVQRR